MMNRKLFFCLLLSSMFVMSSYSKSTKLIKSTLKGEVIDRPQSSQLLLLKQDEDPRIKSVYIPINNGKFEYILNCEYEEQYELIFYDEFEQNSFRAVLFFSEQGVINFTLHPTDRFNENKVEGSKLTKAYWDYLNPILNKYKAKKIEFPSIKVIDIDTFKKKIYSY